MNVGREGREKSGLIRPELRSHKQKKTVQHAKPQKIRHVFAYTQSSALPPKNVLSRFQKGVRARLGSSTRESVCMMQTVARFGCASTERHPSFDGARQARNAKLVTVA